MSKHLTQEQRYHIEAYKNAGYSQNKIAANLKVHPSTIGRELKRNSSPIQERYTAKSAQKMAVLRKRVNSSVPIKMKKEILLLIDQYIEEDYSPEQVSATLRLKHNIQMGTSKNTLPMPTSEPKVIILQMTLR